jgi:hypothetical protein
MNDERQDGALEALARRLGARAAERLDVERIADVVVRRLRDEPRVPRRMRVVPPAWLSLAAGIALLVGGGMMWRRFAPAPIQSASGVAPAGIDLGALSTDQLSDVLRAVDQPLELDPGVSNDTGLEDLTPSELQTLLATLEG